MKQLSRDAYLGTTNINGSGTTGASSSTGSLSAETMIVGTLLTITRIQSIGELIAANVDIQKTYFTANNLSQSDYENFLKVNGVIITFSDSLENKYVIPSTYVNWPPSPNGYPYQVMGANIALGPFMADEDLTSEVAYISCVIEKITGIVPQVTLTELSNVYIVDKHKTTQIENIRNNNINGIGTPNYYQNQIDQIENAISTLGTLVYADSASLGLSVYDPCGSQSQTTTPPTSPITSQITGFALFGGGSVSPSSTLSSFNPRKLGAMLIPNSPVNLTSIYTYPTQATSVGGVLVYSSGVLAAAGNSTLGVFGGGIVAKNRRTAYISSTSIYLYNTNQSMSGASLTYAAFGLAAAGNSTLGVFGVGLTNTSNTCIYTYASNLAIDGQNLNGNGSSTTLTAAGNSTTGVFNLGDSSTLASPTSLYSYASNTVTVGAALANTWSPSVATGNSTLGVFAGSNIFSSSDIGTSIYTYASNTTAIGTNLSVDFVFSGAASNPVFGVVSMNTFGRFSSNVTLNTYTYTYSSNTVITSAQLTYTASNKAATSNSNAGVNT